MKYFIKIFFTLGFSLLSIPSFSSQKLFELNSANSLINPPSLSILDRAEEWSIDINPKLISADNISFTLPIMEGSLMLQEQIYTAQQTRFQAYNNGSRQWSGTLRRQINGDEYVQTVGHILINVIDEAVYGAIFLENSKYEIYSDPTVGTRLAKVNISRSNEHHHDGVFTETDDNQAITPWDLDIQSSSKVESGNAPPVSRVDILVLVDTDMTSNGTIWPTIEARIANDKMMADMILNESGINGVPLNLNILSTQTIDIPVELEPLYYDLNTNTFPNFTALTTNTAISEEIQTLRLQAQADIVVVYVPFTPGPATQDRFEFCGQAGVPRRAAFDQIFQNSFSVMSPYCNPLQLVFLHEIMHNFGSGHRRSDNNAFEQYAYGYVPNNSGIATLMGCADNEFTDPSLTSCNRIPRLSDPDDTWNGFTIGQITVGDNVRFLSECNSQACRRDQLENRIVGPVVDLPPNVNITSPPTDISIFRTEQFTLQASADDDNGVTSFRWQIRDANNILIVEQFVNPPYDLPVSVFQELGQYTISATVNDISNQMVAVSRQVTVVNQAPSIEILSPLSEQTIYEVNPLELSAHASDDDGIAFVNWEIRTAAGNLVFSARGEGGNYVASTSAFNTAGEYTVKATATDTDQVQRNSIHNVTVLAPPLDIQAFIKRTSIDNTPVMVMGMSNAGPAASGRVRFITEVRALNGSAEVSNAPEFCNLTAASLPGNGGRFFRQYTCEIQALEAQNSEYIVWDQLCPGRLTPGGGSALEFSVRLVKLDGNDIDPSNNTAQELYWSPLCTAPI